MSGGKITIYLDLVSPFAYMGYYILRNSPLFKDITITPVPIFLGFLFKATGNIAPLSVKNKDKWIDRERLRWARLFSIPMSAKVAPGFPINTLKPDRALAYIAQRHPAHLPAAFDALYREFWGQEVSNAAVAQPDGDRGFLAALKKSLPEDVVVDVAQNWSGDEAKKALVANTERAEREEVFGLPWFACENAKGEKEGFWGVDHMGCVVRFMGLEDKDGKAGGQVLRALL